MEALVQGIIDVSWIVLHMAIGAFIYAVRFNYARRSKNPYSWTCEVPGCSFNVDTNNMALLDRIVMQHKEVAHDS